MSNETSVYHKSVLTKEKQKCYTIHKLKDVMFYSKERELYGRFIRIS